MYHITRTSKPCTIFTLLFNSVEELKVCYNFTLFLVLQLRSTRDQDSRVGSNQLEILEGRFKEVTEEEAYCFLFGWIW